VTTKRKRRVAVVALLILAVGSAAYAFTAQNTVPDSKAGIGSGVISGYVVSNVKYNLEAGNPANIDSVEFDLDAPAGTVKAKVVSSNPAYTDCTVSATTHYTCNFAANPTVLSADQLSVISVQ
jgi:hypothetical protein